MDSTPNYNGVALPKRIKDAAETRLGKTPCQWQLKLAISTLIGRDSIVIAPTGAGKTLSSILPVLASSKPGFALVLSPLRAVQDVLADRFNEWGVPAIAVNDNDFSAQQQIFQKIKEQTYQVVLTSPEMLLQSQYWYDFLKDKKHSHLLQYVVIYEALGMWQWESHFRSDIVKTLQRNVPFMALSGALTPAAVSELRTSLEMDDSVVLVHRGVDRPNVFMRVIEMKGTRNMPLDIGMLVRGNESDTTILEKTMWFCSSREACHAGKAILLEKLPKQLHGQVEFCHDLRSKATKHRILEDFKKEDGQIRVLICTEAAIMGYDIRGVKHVFQYGTPENLSVYARRASRAGHDPKVQATTTLIAEKSVIEGDGSYEVEVDSDFEDEDALEKKLAGKLNEAARIEGGEDDEGDE